MHGGQIDDIVGLETVDPAIKLLSALQVTDPAKLDLTKLRIKIDSADAEVLKLALITVGLNRDVENLFDPKHSNGAIVKALAQHDDSIVSQYSVWAVLENRKLSINDLGISFDKLESLAPNIQSKLLHVVVDKEADVRIKNDLVIRGTFLPAADAREGLAKGLLGCYYDGLEATTIDWFGQEHEFRIKELLAEHFGRFADVCAPYEDEAFSILDAEPKLARRLRLGAEGKRLYGKIRAREGDGGTLDLFKMPVGDALLGGAPNLMSKAPSKSVLVLNASPRDETRLRLDEEARDLSEELQKVRDAKLVLNVVHHWAVRVDQIQTAILNSKPVVLHFSGHGGRGVLCFEDRLGNAKEITANAFEELCRLCASSVECVVLSACYSDSIASGVSKHIRVVVGCDGSIADDASIAFSRAFYRALANGLAFRESFDWAVNEVRLNLGDAEANKFSIKVRR